MKSKATILLYVLITVGPLTLGFGYSLLYSFGLIGLLNEGFTLAHWSRLWSSGGALQSLGYTFLLTIFSLLGTLVLAVAISWGFLQRRGSGRLYTALFLPMLFPPLIAAFAWYNLLSPAGLLSRFSFHMGLTSELEAFPRLVNDSWSTGILLTHIFLVFPLFTLLFIELGRKEQLREMQKVAQTLGSTPWQFLRRIYVPVLLVKTKPLIWIYGVFLMGTYEVPLILGRSAPQAVSIFITDKLTRFNLLDIPLGHAMAVLYSMLVFLVIAIFVRKKALSLF